MASLGPTVNGRGVPTDPIDSGAGRRFLLDPLRETAWVVGVTCRGFTVKTSNDEVTLVIKVTNTKGRHVVAFVTAHSYAAAMEAWFTAIHSTSYNLQWHEDRFA